MLLGCGLDAGGPRRQARIAISARSRDGLTALTLETACADIGRPQSGPQAAPEVTVAIEVAAGSLGAIGRDYRQEDARGKEDGSHEASWPR